jgi:hypothetical protein
MSHSRNHEVIIVIWDVEDFDWSLNFNRKWLKDGVTNADPSLAWTKVARVEAEIVQRTSFLPSFEWRPRMGSCALLHSEFGDLFTKMIPAVAAETDGANQKITPWLVLGALRAKCLSLIHP